MRLLSCSPYKEVILSKDMKLTLAKAVVTKL